MDNQLTSARFTTLMPLRLSVLLIALLLPLLIMLGPKTTQARSATWSLNPTDGNWNTTGNWIPHTVPNGGADIATFGASNITDISFSAPIRVNSIFFNPDASAFSVSLNPSEHLTLSGDGIINNAGMVQNFATNGGEFSGGEGGLISFTNGATAGNTTRFTNGGSIGGGTAAGTTKFEETSTAGNAVFINNPGGIIGGGIVFLNFANAGTATITCRGGPEPGGGFAVFEGSSSAASATFFLEGASGTFTGSGHLMFENSATAGDAVFTLSGGLASNSIGGQIIFSDSSTAGSATFIINGSEISGAEGGKVEFFEGTSAGTANVIVNGGAAAGGVCFLGNDSDSSMARFQIFGNGELLLQVNRITLGSIEGDGVFEFTCNDVFVGANNLSTTFSGSIGSFGAFHKVGAGTLTLSGANTYSMGTTIEAGALIIANGSGSGTGSGAVSVNAGTLGGSGIIAGATTIGTGSGPGAFLVPAAATTKQSTLTIQSALTFNSDATYTCTFKAKKNKARTDQVIANGVTINGATLNLIGQTQGSLKRGLRLTVISNTSANPINGTFSNLPDGGIVTINGNNFQASYEGGDGNDLTLTVVP